MDVSHRIAHRIRELRRAEGFSLEDLAARSQVSRSNISLIERGESSPTAAVLDRLATALNVSLAALFEEGFDGAKPPAPVARATEQTVWVDPASGYQRRNLSPAVPSALQLVEVIFPAGQRVVYDTDVREIEIHQQIWMIDGVMEITVGRTPWRIETGDCLGMRLDSRIIYQNPTSKPARYVVALANLDWGDRRRKR